MRVRTLVLTLLAILIITATGRVIAQAPATAATPPATLNQLMRGIMFPNSNVIFAAQDMDPATVPQASDPSTATDPLAGSYGGWQAVENSGFAIAEAASLLTVPGRTCSNGRPVPTQNADWAGFVTGLREAGLAAVQAARAKNQDQILDVADKVTEACSTCHDVYREKTAAQGGAANRCTK